MVIREDLDREDEPAGGPAGSVRERPSGGSALEGFQPCPYLAGRPPCGTHHLFPSGANVCWADAGEGKPYRSVSRDTQADHCFAGSAGRAGCRRYERAVAEARPLPRFEPSPADRADQAGWKVPTPHRPHHRRGEKPHARLLFYASWVAPLLLALLMLAVWLR